MKSIFNAGLLTRVVPGASLLAIVIICFLFGLLIYQIFQQAGSQVYHSIRQAEYYSVVRN